MTQRRNTLVPPAPPGADQPEVPFTARSVLASALLGTHPPELPVAQLVRLTSLFGISENRARVALSRMVASGETMTDGAGRYRLTGHLAARQSRQSASRAGTTTRYDGEWWLAVVTTSGSSAEVRASRRRALSYGRLAELREGVWMRPANVSFRVPDAFDGDVELMTARPDGAFELAQRLWDLPAWSARAALLLERLEGLHPDGPDALAPGFELSAAVLRHLQADPLLPPALLPQNWPGEPLRVAYDGWDARYRATLQEWSRTSESVLGGRD
jgi:phenylacetic acid degradation operon negative regulatory protein